MKVKIDLPKYTIHDKETLKWISKSQPNLQMAEYIENLLIRSNVDYEQADLGSNRIVTMMEIDGIRCAYLRFINYPGQFNIRDVMRDNDAEFAFCNWIVEDQKTIPRLINIGPMVFGYHAGVFGQPITWELYDKMCAETCYKAVGNKIFTYFDTSREFPEDPAYPLLGTYRRVWKEISKTMDGYEIDSAPTIPMKIIERVNDCMVAVTAPGTMPLQPDRTLMLLLSCGCGVITPRIPEVFHNEQLVEGVHYIACKEDYSDVADIIKEIDGRHEMLTQIGFNAKTWFRRNMTPNAIWSLIKKSVFAKL
jgi:hypothetical protein